MDNASGIPDAEVTENLIQQDKSAELIDDEDGKTRDERIVELFKQYLRDDSLEIRVERLKDDSVPAMALRAGSAFSGDDAHPGQRDLSL